MRKLFNLILCITFACCFVISGCGKKSETQTYAIIFKCENRADIVKTVKKGDTLTEIPTLPEVTGYTFVWSETDFTDISQNMTVIAVKTPVKSIVTLNLNGGTLDVNTVNLNYDDEYTLPSPTKSGYRFNKWIAEDGSVFPASGVCKLLGNISLIADYVQTHTVTFMQDGEIIAVITVDHGSSLEVTPLPKPVDGKVVGWDRTDFSNITEDLVVNAVLGVYKITYNLGTYKFANESKPRDIGTEGGKLNRTYDVVSPNGSIVLLEPTCYGYKFVKWQYNGVDFDGKNFSFNHDIEIVAVWEVDKDSPRWDSPAV